MKKFIILLVVIVSTVTLYTQTLNAESWWFKSKTSTGATITTQTSTKELCLSSEALAKTKGEQIIVACNNRSSSTGTSSTFTKPSIFGGRIVYTEATEVTTTEASGYDCEIPGSTIEIRALKGPTSYFISSGTNARTNTTPASGQSILGKYSGEQTITCTKDNEDGTRSQKLINLPIITLFGTSRI